MMRIVLTGLLAAALLVGMLACNKQGESEEQAVTEPVHLELAVTGMTCESCENAITTTLLGMPGVETVTASHVDKLVTVDYVPGAVDEAALAAKIELLGFSVGDEDTAAMPAGDEAEVGEAMPEDGSTTEETESEG